MEKSVSMGCLSVMGAAVMLISGCGANYYQVREPFAGKNFYTNRIDEMSCGAVKFTDARSGATVTIQNSAIKEITVQEYNVGVYTPEPVSPSPVQAGATPVATPVQPAAAPAQPAATPAQPAATPAQPAATPAQPAATPAPVK